MADLISPSRSAITLERDNIGVAIRNAHGPLERVRDRRYPRSTRKIDLITIPISDPGNASRINPVASSIAKQQIARGIKCCWVAVERVIDISIGDERDRRAVPGYEYLSSQSTLTIATVGSILRFAT